MISPPDPRLCFASYGVNGGGGSSGSTPHGTDSFVCSKSTANCPVLSPETADSPVQANTTGGSSALDIVVGWLILLGSGYAGHTYPSSELIKKKRTAGGSIFRLCRDGRRVSVCT